MVETRPAPTSAAVLTSNHRLNNFDLLRLLLAIGVIFLHAYGISLNPSLKFLAKLANLSLGDWSPDATSLAVKCFFVVSGYLIFKSYDDSPSLKEFFRKRFLRIYPAYAVVIVATALACSLLTTLPAQQYFSGPFWKYILANLTFCTPLYSQIPGTFLNNPGLKMVNGALWTIKVEVMFYCAVPVLRYGLRRFPLIPAAIVLYCGSIVYKAALLFTHHVQLANQLPGQLSYFISGALLYYKGDAILSKIRWLLLPCVALFWLENTLGIELFQPYALAILVLSFVLRMPVLTPLRPRWDLSYGIYIIHFPVLEWLVSEGVFRNHPYTGLLLAMTVIAMLAVASWVWVERPMLRRKVRRAHLVTSQ